MLVHALFGNWTMLNKLNTLGDLVEEVWVPVLFLSLLSLHIRLLGNVAVNINTGNKVFDGDNIATVSIFQKYCLGLYIDFVRKIAAV